MKSCRLSRRAGVAEELRELSCCSSASGSSYGQVAGGELMAKSSFSFLLLCWGSGHGMAKAPWSS